MLSHIPPIQPVLAQLPLWVLQHLPVIVFVFCLGACVGSFINVVIHRLPAGMSVISPPSRCPTCGAKLKFFRENLPILGWFMIRGRCRYCGVKVSCQYMIIELMMALIFLGLYIVLFMTGRTSGWWGDIGGVWWTTNMIFRVWPAYIALAFLLASLVAMTVIDARTFTIPIQVPLFVTVTAFIAYPLLAILPRRAPLPQTWPIPGTDWQWTFVALLGMLGVVIALILLKSGRVRYSFADYHEYVKEGEALADYPHARREMLREIAYLTPCMVGIAAGYLLGGLIPDTSAPPQFIQAVAATFLGYLVGGALIWAIRILGTLAFGREAMGLGDVHLLAAVGAVLGWYEVVIICFIAPFSGLAWALLSMGFSSVFKTARRELPYGPHLAVATLVVILCRPGLSPAWQAVMPGVPLFGRPGFVVPQQPAQPPAPAGRPAPGPGAPTEG